jgi:hypothetical protein
MTGDERMDGVRMASPVDGERLISVRKEKKTVLEGLFFFY